MIFFAGVLSIILGRWTPVASFYANPILHSTWLHRCPFMRLYDCGLWDLFVGKSCHVWRQPTQRLLFFVQNVQGWNKGSKIICNPGMARFFNACGTNHQQKLGGLYIYIFVQNDHNMRTFWRPLTNWFQLLEISVGAYGSLMLNILFPRKTLTIWKEPPVLEPEVFWLRLLPSGTNNGPKLSQAGRIFRVHGVAIWAVEIWTKNALFHQTTRNSGENGTNHAL